MRYLLILSWALWLCRPAAAQIVGNDATPLDPGKVRLTYIYIGTNAGLRFDSSGRPSVQVASESDINSLRVTLGLVEDLDIHVQTGEGFLSREDGSRLESPTFGSGADDSAVRLRWRFVHEDGLQIALLSTTTIPTGTITSEDRLGIGQGFLSQTEDLVARQDFDRFQLWTEIFASLPIGRYAYPTAIVWGGTVCLGYTIGDSVIPTAELNYTNLQPGNVVSLAGTFGLTWVADPHLIVQAAVQQTFAGINTARTTSPIVFIHYNF